MGIFKGKEIFTIKPWLTDYKQNVEQLKKILGLSSDNMLPAIEEGDDGKVVGVSSGKYALVEGGGGSSDFSTAEGTFNLTFPEGVTPDGIVVNSAFQYHDAAYQSNDGIPFEDNKGTILLCEGVGRLISVFAYANDTEYMPANNSIVVTGNIEIPAFGNPRVTGDFTYSCNMVESLP